MSFSEVDAKYDKKDGKFKLLDILGEIQKNKFSTVRVAKVKCWGAEFVQLQVWKEENDKKFAAKGQNIIVKPEVAHALGEILVKI
jgi:predicted ATP-grasp superfamily ATP-dependent carboligase